MMEMYNYKTQAYEEFTGDDFPSVERFLEFIPQLPAAKGLYEVLLERGYDPTVALAEVLKECCKH